MRFLGLFRHRGLCHPLDEPIARLSKKDVVRLRDLLKSIAGFGATGSGKTSAVIFWLAMGIITHPRSTMLIPCAKPEDKRDWEQRYAKAGRTLLVFEPGGSLRFNVLDYILKSGGGPRDVTRCLMTLNETMQSGDGLGNEKFWVGQQERAVYNSVVIVNKATGGVSAPLLQEFLAGAAHSPDDLRSEAFREGSHNRALRAAIAADKTPEERADVQLAVSYFINELPHLADRTASSIMVGVYGLFHALCTGHTRTLLSSETNITPETMLNGGISIAVNMSPSEWGPTGTLVNAAWKWATQWAVLRRDARPTDYFNVIFVDEAQQFVNSGDSDYLAQCRSHLGCMCFFTQSRQSYYSTLAGRDGHDKTDALLANFNLKLFNALGDVETAHWASHLVGKALQMRFSGSSGPPNDMWETLMGNHQGTSSYSMQMDNILEPNVFMHGMRTGGPDNGYMVDAVAVKTAEPFSSGANWMWVTFKQG